MPCEIFLFSKTSIVYNFHNGTVKAAAGIIGTMGKTSSNQLTRSDIMRRVSDDEVRTLSEHFPEVEPGCLLNGTGPERMQEIWNIASSRGSSTNTPTSSSTTYRKKRWIY